MGKLGKLEAGTPEWKDLIFTDWPKDAPITEETRENCIRYGVRGSVRASTGRIYTDAEYEDKCERILSTPLP